MSNSGEARTKNTIPELLEVLNRIDEIVKSGRTTEENSTKLKITLNSYLNQLTDKINEFFSDLTHTSKEKLDTTLKVMQHLDELLVFIPRKNDLYLTWLNYASMTNFVRSNLAFIHHEQNIGKSVSTAGSLSQILLGEIQHIEEIPKLPPLQEPVKYFEYFVPLFNAIQSTFSVYHTLIDSLPVITLDDFIQWTNDAIWHYKMLRELLETLDITELLETRKIKKMENFYTNILNSANTLASSSYIFATIFEKLEYFPEEIDDQEILPERTLEGLIQHTEEIIDYMNDIEEEIDSAYSNFLVNRNDKLEDVEIYSSFEIVRDDMKMMVDLLRFDKNKQPDNTELIDKILTQLQETQETLVQEIGDIDSVINSYTFSSFIEILKEMMPFVAAKSVALSDTRILENFLFKYQKPIRNAGLQDYGEFHYIKILCLLHVYSRLDPSNMELVDYYTELNIIKESFTLNPRFYVGANLLLMQIVELGIPLSDTTIFEYNIIEILQQNCSFSNYSQEVESYILYLKDRDHMDIEQLQYRKEHQPFDIYSWIFPDWSEISDIDFIPFSRLKDSVLIYE